MATKNDTLVFTKNQSFVNASINDKSFQYSNFNLNQTCKNPNVSSPVQFKSKLNNNKQFGKEKPESLKASSMSKLSSKSFVPLNDESNEVVKKLWKNVDNSKSNNNNSTLSLHIAAYENSIEVKNSDTSNENGSLKMIKKLKIGSTSDFPNPYEFPRHREDQIVDPEVMQFKASQQLLNPNASNNRQQRNLPDHSPSTTSSCSDGVIDTLSADSMLTTVPCTTITEIQRPPLNNNNSQRFKHEMNGWSPDIYGNARDFAAGDYNNKYSKPPQPLTSTPKPTAAAMKTIPKANGSSVYMMNYEQKFPPKTPRPKVMQKIEPPSGFAVPVKASASDSDGPSKIFSSPLPVYHLKANSMHRGTFYKTTFQSIEKLDSTEIQRGIWTIPNASPRMSVLHLSCNSGAVTAVNLATGQAIQKTLSSTSISAGSEISERSPPSLAEESTRMMKLRKKWASQNISSSSSSQQSSNYDDGGNQYDEAWNEVNKEIKNLQNLFDENAYSNNYNSYENVYRTDEELEYQRQLLHNYAPYRRSAESSPTKTLTEESDGEEESEMQFLQASEPSEFEKNIQFRNAFEKIFKGRYEPGGEIDQWLKMMTDETIANQQQPQQHRHQGQHFNDESSDEDATLVDEDESFDEIDYDDEDEDDEVAVGVKKEEEKQVLQILSTCENVLKQLESVTAVSAPPPPPPRKSSKFGFRRKLPSIKECEGEYDETTTTPRAASSSAGYEESFDIIRY